MLLECFFEGGRSKFGAAQDKEFDMGNLKCKQPSDLSCSDDRNKPFTLSGYFEATKLKTLIDVQAKWSNALHHPVIMKMICHKEHFQTVLLSVKWTVGSNHSVNSKDRAKLDNLQDLGKKTLPSSQIQELTMNLSLTHLRTVSYWNLKRNLKTEKGIAVYHWVRT